MSTHPLWDGNRQRKRSALGWRIAVGATLVVALFREMRPCPIRATTRVAPTDPLYS